MMSAGTLFSCCFVCAIIYTFEFLHRAIETADSRSYGTMLREAPEFRNPSDVPNMASAFGLSDVDRQPSLMRGLYR
jgi:hypothetical protein